MRVWSMNYKNVMFNHSSCDLLSLFWLDVNFFPQQTDFSAFRKSFRVEIIRQGFHAELMNVKNLVYAITLHDNKRLLKRHMNCTITNGVQAIIKLISKPTVEKVVFQGCLLILRLASSVFCSIIWLNVDLLLASCNVSLMASDSIALASFCVGSLYQAFTFWEFGRSSLSESSSDVRVFSFT